MSPQRSFAVLQHNYTWDPDTPQGLEQHIIPSTPTALDAIAEHFEHYLDQHYDDRGLQISIALREAVQNYMKDANKWDPQKNVTLTAWHDTTGFYATIGAEGPGFNVARVWKEKQRLLQAPDYVQQLGKTAHGLGLYIISQYADVMSFDKDGKTSFLAFDARRKVA